MNNDDFDKLVSLKGIDPIIHNELGGCLDGYAVHDLFVHELLDMNISVFYINCIRNIISIDNSRSL